MVHLQQFTYGALTPAIGYAMSFFGSLLGLLCTSRARNLAGTARYQWLALSALSIGGTGIWVMHFIGIIGFSIPGMTLRYNVPLTVLSAVVSIGVVGIGLMILGTDPKNMPRLLGGGLVTGLGVVGMHYMGMAAMRMPGHISYDPLLVVASILIAIVAATAALWFTLTTEGKLAPVAAALIMGVAVSGMHYTAMAGLRVTRVANPGPVTGASAFEILTPLVGGVVGLTFLLLIVIALSPTGTELAEEATFAARLEEMQRRREHRNDPQVPTPRPPGPAAGPVRRSAADGLYRPTTGIRIADAPPT